MRHPIHPPLALCLAAAAGLALSACDVLEYPELEGITQAQQIGPVDPELGGAPDFDLEGWCRAQMARDPDPCEICDAHQDACHVTCTELRPGQYTCGPVDADRCQFAEEHCARCELCAPYAPPPTVDPVPLPRREGQRAVPIDPDSFSPDPKPTLKAPPLPSSPFAAPAPPAPEPPPCGLPTPVLPHDLW